MNTQGFEKEVIEGGTNTLKTRTLLKIEVPIKPMYEMVKRTFYKIVEFMKLNKFSPINFEVEGVNYDGAVKNMEITFLNLKKAKS